MLARRGLAIVADRDLTDELRPRTLARIARLETLNRALHRFAPSAGMRELLDSYRGGLALERLYRAGADALSPHRRREAQPHAPASTR